MKNIFFFLLLFLAINQTSFAGDGENYAVSKIPAELLKGANVVKRYEEIKFELVSLDKSRLYKKVALTILNENGDEYAHMSEWYDKLRKIEQFEGRLFDATGNKIKTVKKADIQDVSGTDDGTLADGSRIKAHSFYYKNYPYTIEYETEVVYDGSLMFPRWLPQYSEKYSVEYSGITIKVPADYQARYRSFNIAGKVTEEVKGNDKYYHFEMKNMLPIKYEPIAPYYMEILPCIMFCPSKFKLEGYEGDLSTWEGFGEFQLLLNKDRDILPDNIKLDVHRLTDNVADKKEKIRLLYEYMQQHTRYISIQLGIGGLQPFDAKFVATKNYGDCKALSNYMYALLKEAGIKSCYTIIKAGEGEKFCLPDFPADYFNHIILGVPLQKDTMWLECTNQTMPAGYLGDFTEDRFALMVDENGGKLVHTPKYNYKTNLQVRKVVAVIDETGRANINTNTSFRAMAQDDLHGMINDLSKEKVKEYLNRSISLPQYELSDFKYEEHKSSLPEIDELLKIDAPAYATVSGKRMFIVPNMFSKTGIKLMEDTARKYEVNLKSEYTDIDTVEISIPNGYQPEAIPQAVKLETKFGKYSCVTKVDGNKIYYYRSMEKFSGRFPSTAYAELVKFHEQIYKADRAKLVMVKKEG